MPKEKAAGAAYRAADRGPVGICLPGGHDDAFLFRRLRREPQPLRMVVREFATAHPPSRPIAAERLGTVRHVRERGEHVRRRPRHLRGSPRAAGRRSKRHGRENICHPGRSFPLWSPRPLTVCDAWRGRRRTFTSLMSVFALSGRLPLDAKASLNRAYEQIRKRHRWNSGRKRNRSSEPPPRLRGPHRTAVRGIVPLSHLIERFLAFRIELFIRRNNVAIERFS